MTFNQNLYPPDGYIFHDEDGVLHRGDSWKNLRELVTDYRARNGKPPGDLEREIDAYHCAKYPGLCHADIPLPPQPPRGTHLTARVLNWLGHLMQEVRRSATRFVSREEAKRRAAICAVCPAQSSLPDVCETCISTIKSSRRVTLGEEGPVHKSLHPCGILGEDAQISVHLEQKPSTEAALPAHCWRK
jgi:hypothetical protein